MILCSTITWYVLLKYVICFLPDCRALRTCLYALCRKFGDIFDVDHFISYLKADVRIIWNIPDWFIQKDEFFPSIKQVFLTLFWLHEAFIECYYNMQETVGNEGCVHIWLLNIIRNSSLWFCYYYLNKVGKFKQPSCHYRYHKSHLPMHS
jgi:hypothetical protein